MFALGLISAPSPQTDAGFRWIFIDEAISAFFWRNFHQTVQQSIAEQLIFEFVSSLRRSVSYSM